MSSPSTTSSKLTVKSKKPFQLLVKHVLKEQRGSKRYPLTSFVDGKFVEIPSSTTTTDSSSLLSRQQQQQHHHHDNNNNNNNNTVIVPATAQTIEAALETARIAQYDWYHSYSPMDRATILRKAASILASSYPYSSFANHHERQYQKGQDDEEEVVDVPTKLAILETLDTNRPIMETQYEASAAADCLNWFAGLAPSIGSGTHHELGRATPTATTTTSSRHIPNNSHSLYNQSFGYTKREPYGLTVGIGAWNYPLQSAVWKSAPALAFGNSMVFKPSEYTPRTALELCLIYQQAGVPDGVFNVVLDDGKGTNNTNTNIDNENSGNFVGQTLVNDKRVQKISFTGSVQTGRSIYTAAAKDFKKVTLELGGKSPLIIFDDCSTTDSSAASSSSGSSSNKNNNVGKDHHILDAAVSGAMMANWLSSGQVCSNGTRVYVQRGIYDAFLQRLIERTKSLRIGNPFDPTTQIGPMISKQHMESVLRYIDIGIHQDKATLAYGGKQIIMNNDEYDSITNENTDGYSFLQPTIFTNCHKDMQIVQNEIFGMVMCIMEPFDTEDEALFRANNDNDIYGLSAGVFTSNLQRAHRMVANLHAGVTWVNNYNLAPPELPWGGGYKSSGIGSENGYAGGAESWTRTKSVYMEMNDMESFY